MGAHPSRPFLPLQGDHVKRVAVAGLVLAALTLSAPFALAQDVDTGPDSQACADARADLDARLAAVLDLSPEVLDEADDVADLTPEFLESLLADDEAGEGAQAVIRAALDAGLVVDRDCADPAPPVTETTTPTPTPTTTPTPTLPPETTTSATRAPVPDGGGDFDQVGRAPRGGVATGG